MRTSVSLAFFAAALGCSTLTSAAPPTTYRVTEFGGDDTANQLTFIGGINNLGAVTLTVVNFSNGTSQGYLWQDGQRTPLSVPDSICGSGAKFAPNGINDRGQIVGVVTSANGCYQSVIWQGGKVVQVIGPPPTGYASVYGGGLNDLDLVAGTAEGIQSSVQTSFLWQNGKFTLLPGLPGSQPGGPGGTEIGGFNELGVAVGTSGATDGQHAVIWRNGAVADLGICAGAFNSYAASINNLGVIVGSCDTYTFSPVIWQNGQMTPLPMPASGPQSVQAGSINDFGQIVGASYPTGGYLDDAGAALLWQGGTVYDLNTLIAPNDPLKPYIRLLQAGAITDTGIILANGEDSRVPNNLAIGFVLTPVH
jgi:uncharacterized membrane protein